MVNPGRLSFGKAYLYVVETCHCIIYPAILIKQTIITTNYYFCGWLARRGSYVLLLFVSNLKVLCFAFVGWLTPLLAFISLADKR
jgi:hypothetical protein